MQKSEAIAIVPRKLGPKRARLFQQRKGSTDVGLHEILRPPDRTVHMTFCREVNNDLRSTFPQHARHLFAVGDIPLHKAIARIVRDGRQIPEISCVGELVEVNEQLNVILHFLQDKVGTYKPGPAGDKNAILHAKSLLPAGIMSVSQPGHIRSVDCNKKWPMGSNRIAPLAANARIDIIRPSFADKLS